jgi:hypothetical protein
MILGYFFTQDSDILLFTKYVWATFWAAFSQNHLVTLPVAPTYMLLQWKSF